MDNRNGAFMKKKSEKKGGVMALLNVRVCAYICTY